RIPWHRRCRRGSMGLPHRRGTTRAVGGGGLRGSPRGARRSPDAPAYRHARLARDVRRTLLRGLAGGAARRRARVRRSPPRPGVARSIRPLDGGLHPSTLRRHEPPALKPRHFGHPLIVLRDGSDPGLFARGSARRAIAVYAAAREERPIVCSRPRARPVRLDRAHEAPSRYLEGSKRSAMTHHQRLILVWTVSLGCTPAPATSDTSD